MVAFIETCDEKGLEGASRCIQQEDDQRRLAAAAVLTFAGVHRKNTKKVTKPEQHLDTVTQYQEQKVREGSALGYAWPLYRQLFTHDPKYYQRAGIDWSREALYYRFIDEQTATPPENLETLIPALAKAEQLHPDNPVYKFFQSVCYFIAKDYQASWHAIDAACRQRPDFFPYKLWRAEVNYYWQLHRNDQQNIAKARRELAEILQAWPWLNPALKAEILRRFQKQRTQLQLENGYLLDPGIFDK